MIGPLAALALATAPCTPLPGMAAVLAKSDLQFLIFGEAHGTAQAPAVFLDAVCAAAAHRAVAVGLEFTPADQPALTAFMRSDGGVAARQALLASPAWADRGGRQSLAVLELIDGLRRLKRAGAAIDIVAFDAAPTSSGTSAAREEAMARTLIAAGRGDQLVLALTGSGHADRTGWTSATPQFRSAAQNLPASRTLSLGFARPGGEYWTCRAPSPGQPTACQVWPMPVREPVRPRGVDLGQASRPGFDGVFSAGGAYTASPPARPEA